MVLAVYESLCSDERFTSVEHNVSLLSPDGARQIDVLVKHRHAGIEYKTAIECRDYNGKIDVTHVDGFGSKLADVGANKGILVSRKGFTKTAIQKARRLGIGLCQIDTANSLLPSMAVEMPIVVAIIEPIVEIDTVVRPSRTAHVHPNASSIINDTRIRDLVVADIQSGRIAVPSEEVHTQWFPENFPPPYWIRDLSNDRVNVDHFTVNLTLRPLYFAGTSAELPDLLVHKQIGEEQSTVLIPSSYRVTITNTFARYKSMREIPKTFAGALLSVLTADEVGGKWQCTPGQAWRLKL